MINDFEFVRACDVPEALQYSWTTESQIHARRRKELLRHHPDVDPPRRPRIRQVQPARRKRRHIREHRQPPRVDLAQHQRRDVRARDEHHERGRHAVAHHVAKRDEHALGFGLIENEKIIVIAAGLIAVRAMPGDVQAAGPGRPPVAAANAMSM